MAAFSSNTVGRVVSFAMALTFQYAPLQAPAKSGHAIYAIGNGQPARLPVGTGVSAAGASGAQLMGAVTAVLGAGFCRSQSSRKSKSSKSSRQQMYVVNNGVSETSADDCCADSADQLVRYMGGNVVVRAVCATELVKKVVSMHKCSPMAGIALGRALLATTLLANGRDEGESLQLRIQGDGPIGSIITEASSALTVRGMVGNPHADAPTVPDLVGVGSASTLRLTRTHPYWKRPYTGTIGLKCGEIAEDVVQYLGTSEQTPASMGLSVEWDSEAPWDIFIR